VKTRKGTGDHRHGLTLLTTGARVEAQNTIVMEGTQIECGRRIIDSLIGREVKILGHEQNIPRGHRLILGDRATVTL